MNRKAAAATVACLASVAVYESRRRSRNKYVEEISGKIDNVKKSGDVKVNLYFGKAVEKSCDAVERAKIALGVPGLVVGVSVHGKLVWAQGKLHHLS